MIDTSVAGAAHTAVVHSPDGILFVASASDEADVAAQLADYVSQRCADTLWPAAAREVLGLIAANRHDEAITAYFANVGQRWDEERLERPPQNIRLSQ